MIHFGQSAWRVGFGAALAGLLLLNASACQSARTAPALRGAPPALILVSFDGFARDYLGRAATPNLDRLAREGVRAEALIPVFPTKTFPNHYSMVTGLQPESHGIVSNRFHDPELGADFVFKEDAAAADPRWWGGEPIWVTAGRHGLQSATMFWPGSDVEIAGARPTYWKPYDARVPGTRRVDQVLAWLDLPADARPSFVTLYLSDVDGAGHAHGPASPEVDRAVERVDAMLGRLIRGLEERGRLDSVDIVVVSDHGMAESSPRRVIFVDDHVDLSTVRIVDWDPVLAVWPQPGREAEVRDALSAAHPHLRVWRKQETPQRWHYRKHRRIPPLLAVADAGWRIATRGYFARYPERFDGGMHGYDNAAVSMHGIFVARGPHFREGVVVEPFGSIDVYPLLAELLGIPPVPHDGDLERVRPLLAR